MGTPALGGDLLISTIAKYVLESSLKTHTKNNKKKKYIPGMCTKCTKDIKNDKDMITIKGKKYHKSCHACDICGWELGEEAVHVLHDTFYCDQHYRP